MTYVMRITQMQHHALKNALFPIQVPAFPRAMHSPSKICLHTEWLLENVITVYSTSTIFATDLNPSQPTPLAHAPAMWVEVDQHAVKAHAAYARCEQVPHSLYAGRHGQRLHFLPTVLESGTNVRLPTCGSALFPHFGGGPSAVQQAMQCA